MSCLDAVRELLERVADPKMWREEMGELIWRGQSPDGNLIETQDPRTLISEALELIGAEPSEQMRRDHEAMGKLRRGSELWFYEYGEGLRGLEDIPLAERDAMLIQGKTFSHDPADAILGTESEGTS